MVSVPLSNSKPISPTAVKAETPLKLVIKTPVYKNYPSVLHAPCTQNQLTFSNFDSATTYSSFANDLVTFSSDEQIEANIIESIETILIKSLHLRLSFVKIFFLNTNPTLSKQIQSMFANTRCRSYVTLNKIVLTCLHDLGF